MLMYYLQVVMHTRRHLIQVKILNQSNPGAFSYKIYTSFFFFFFFLCRIFFFFFGFFNFFFSPSFPPLLFPPKFFRFFFFFFFFSEEYCLSFLGLLLSFLQFVFLSFR